MNKILKFILSPLIIPTAFAKSAKNSKVMRVLLYLYLLFFVLTGPITCFFVFTPLPLSIHLLFFLHRVMMKVINEE